MTEAELELRQVSASAIRAAFSIVYAFSKKKKSFNNERSPGVTTIYNAVRATEMAGTVGIKKKNNKKQTRLPTFPTQSGWMVT